MLGFGHRNLSLSDDGHYYPFLTDRKSTLYCIHNCLLILAMALPFRCDILCRHEDWFA
uniref:Uncharacterized protein n=1 Tax=Anguilla anguilla TaxID=7936 RepID=A0A0E9W5K1_ANGAN